MIGRGEFFKRMAALVAAGASGVTLEDLWEDEKDSDWMVMKLRARVSDLDEDLTWEQRVPSTLNPDTWAELGLSEDGLHSLALKHWVIKVQCELRARIRHGASAEEAIEAAQNYKVGGKRPKVTLTSKDLERVSLTPQQIEVLKQSGLISR